MENPHPDPDKTKKIKRKPRVKTLTPTDAGLPINESSEVDKILQQALSNMIQNGTEKYAAAAKNQFRQSRSDFDALQPIVAEFLENFIIIGHTLDGQRMVARYTKNHAGTDALTELCKKVLVNLMIQESNGE